MPFEDWESDHKISKVWWLIIGLILLVASVGVVSAVYHITSPTSPTVTVRTPATLSTPTVSTTDVIIGDTITISTTLSDHLAGVQVYFFENGNEIGSDYTDDSGVATYNRVMINAGSYTYVCDCIHP